MPENKRIPSYRWHGILSFLMGALIASSAGDVSQKGLPALRSQDTSVAKMHHEERDGDVFKTDAPLPSILSHCQREIVLGARDAMMTTQKRKMIVCPVLAHARDGAR